MARQKIEAPELAPVAKLVEIGDSVEGVWVGIRRALIGGEFNNVHDFQGKPEADYTDEAGAFSMWGTVDLDRKLTQLKSGDYVYITLANIERNGARTFKTFDVEIDDGK